ncbi:MAG: ion transporter, partial [Pseudomonadota bacterium]
MLKRRVWEIVEAANDGDRASRWFDGLILMLIFFNVAAVILETVELYQQTYGAWFYWFEVFSIAIFTVEYLSRIWSCTEDERYQRPFWGRLKFGLRPLLLVDLIVLIPFYLSLFGMDTRALRALRLLRVFSIVKMGRYTESFRLIL